MMQATVERRPAISQLEAALHYGARGWRVLPMHSVGETGCTCREAGCKHPGKHPHLKSWQRIASSRAARIRAWWQLWPDANVGVLTGGPVGLLVLDVDPRTGGDLSLAALQRICGAIPPTPRSRTGTGGCHYWFTCWPDVPSRAGALGPGLDVKSRAGCVTAPPSVGRDQPYAWEVAPDACDLAPFPAVLVALMAQLHAQRPSLARLPVPRPGPPPAGDLDAYGAAALRAELDTLAHAVEGERNQRLNRAAFNLDQLVAAGALQREMVESALEEIALQTGLLSPEIHRTIRSSLDAGCRRPRLIQPRIHDAHPPGRVFAESPGAS
jgi:Bifunctional DNA primase/polymerase, N-terminal